MGSRNGTRPKPIQTAEGEITIAMPQVRDTAAQYVSRVITGSEGGRPAPNLRRR